MLGNLQVFTIQIATNSSVSTLLLRQYPQSTRRSLPHQEPHPYVSFSARRYRDLKQLTDGTSLELISEQVVHGTNLQLLSASYY